MNTLDRRLLAFIRTLPFAWGRGRRWLIRRLRRQGAFPVQTEVFGRPMRLFGDNTAEAKFLISPQVYNRREIRFLAQHMPATGGVFADVGANAGIYAFSIGAEQNADATILCIEPNPDLVRRLEHNFFTLNDFASDDVRIVIDRRAIGDGVGRARLMVEAGLGEAYLADGGDGLQVDVVPLATILADHRIDRVDALKIDIEGHEDRALGAFFDATAPSLWPKAIVLEHCNDDRWRRDLWTQLATCGYRRHGRTRNNTLLARA